MGRDWTDDTGPSRRQVLSSVVGAAAFSGLPALVGDEGDGGTDLLSTDADTDGWLATGDVELDTVDYCEWFPTITWDDEAIEVSVSGEPGPRMDRRLDGVDLVESPYLVADVAPGVLDGSDVAVAFAFSFSRGSLDGDRDVLAWSEPVTIRQAMPGRVYWDASDVARSERASATHLGLAWTTADTTARPADADEPYTGELVVGAVRATDRAETVGRARFADTLRNLEAEHGSYRRTEVAERDDTGERGRFVFASGATAPYRFDVLDEDRYRLTLADVSVQLGGGW